MRKTSSSLAKLSAIVTFQRFSIARGGAQQKRSLSAKKVTRERFESTKSTASLSKAGSMNDREGEEETITSVENVKVKRMVKLRTRRSFRDEERACVVSGGKVLLEIFQANAFGKMNGVECKRAFVSEEFDDDYNERIDRVIFRDDDDRKRKSTKVSAKVMKKVAGVENADNVDYCAEVTKPDVLEAREFFKKTKMVRKVLCLDGVQDPGNVGTLLRTAEAFGFDAVGLGPKTCDPFNEKALRSSKGSCFRMQMFSWKTSEEFFDALERGGKFERRKNVLAAMLVGENCLDVSKELGSVDADDAGKVCIVLGSEGTGVSKDIEENSRAMTIPTPGVTESLNVAVAGGILMMAFGK